MNLIHALLAQKPRRESPKSDDPPEVVHKDAVVGRDEQAPQPTTRKDSYDRVEKLRKEMRTASSSGQTQSFDVQMTRLVDFVSRL